MFQICILIWRTGFLIDLSKRIYENHLEWCFANIYVYQKFPLSKKYIPLSMVATHSITCHVWYSFYLPNKPVNLITNKNRFKTNTHAQEMSKLLSVRLKVQGWIQVSWTLRLFNFKIFLKRKQINSYLIMAKLWWWGPFRGLEMRGKRGWACFQRLKGTILWSTTWHLHWAATWILTRHKTKHKEIIMH